MNKLFTPYKLAGLELPNRIVMEPITRARVKSGIPDELTAEYYRQRADAGLIVTEGAPVSREGTGCLFVPGIFSDQQVEGWKKVVQAVHSANGRIFLHLWHAGRASHVSLQEDGKAPVSSVAITSSDVTAYAWIKPNLPGTVPASIPRALETDEVPRITQDFVKAGKRAMEAGFDGVEVHGAHGHIFEQFINGELNTRQDRYGGSIENRLRFLLETLDALIDSIGGQNVGVRLSPFGRLLGMRPFTDEKETWLAAAIELGKRNLAYVNLSNQHTMGTNHNTDFFADFRKSYKGALIIAGGYEYESAEKALDNNELDLVGFAHHFVSNPDLVDRLNQNWPLETIDGATLYGPYGAKGYTDYPRYAGN